MYFRALRLSKNISSKMISVFNLVSRGFKTLSSEAHFIGSGIHILQVSRRLLCQFAQRTFRSALLFIQRIKQRADLFVKTGNNLLSFLMKRGLSILLMTSQLLLPCSS